MEEKKFHKKPSVTASERGKAQRVNQGQTCFVSLAVITNDRIRYANTMKRVCNDGETPVSYRDAVTKGTL